MLPAEIDFAARHGLATALSRSPQPLPFFTKVNEATAHLAGNKACYRDGLQHEPALVGMLPLGRD
ncbi:MAG: hypothetical protein ACFCVD_24920 [Nodosilinea sp.]